jgi:hypothetical protein
VVVVLVANVVVVLLVVFLLVEKVVVVFLLVLRLVIVFVVVLKNTSNEVWKADDVFLLVGKVVVVLNVVVVLLVVLKLVEVTLLVERVVLNSPHDSIGLISPSPEVHTTVPSLAHITVGSGGPNVKFWVLPSQST